MACLWLRRSRGRWPARCPFVLFERPCVFGVACRTVRGVITIPVHTSFDEWNKGDFSFVMTGGREVTEQPCAGGHPWNNFPPSGQGNRVHLHFPSQEGLISFVTANLWERVNSGSGITTNCWFLFQERREHPWSECGLNKQCLCPGPRCRRH